jgi:hypothetical protein
MRVIRSDAFSTPIPPEGPDSRRAAGRARTNVPRADGGGGLSPQALFDALDGRIVRASTGEWRVEIYSVSDDRQTRWVQLGLGGDPAFCLTMRLNPDADSAYALNVLTSWLTNRESTADIVSIA